ncbi:virion structural protein [Erwinia phage vB_EamM_ChrisDB]|uniref:virion structural protein n=1 Tax=Erwinia phage vB_EamM_ChrisDB TaxID=1883371 RepID=UPI00081C9E1F|nr:virion structural protein [Erwinia phage vB_EamM_ChrisDB]ANZ48733.1 putative virion structural protein [Erwinia phage vB_EamM_ChrisDB]
MGLYSKTSLDMLCQLIKRDNPQFTNPLDAQSIMVLSGPLTSGLGASGRNARITLNGRTGTGIVQKKEFFYDRINIGTLFNGITVVFDAAGSSKTIADLLPALNEQYGLSLEATDLSNGTTALSYGYEPSQVTLNIAGTSVAYTGSLTVTWSRKPVGIYPDSGPGSKVLLIGTLDEGYFGLVPETELFSAPTLHSKINEGMATPAGTLSAQPATRQWYKFARDGKILYLANYNHITIRWQELYARGAVYETDQPADKQFPSDAVIVAQKPVIRKVESGREWYLSPCMPRLSSTFPWDYTAPNVTPDPTGDVARLFARIVKSGGFATGEWDGQTIDGGGFWFSTTSGNDPTKAFGSSMTGLQQNVYDKASFNGGWRPMLELVDLDKVAVPLENFIGTPDGVLRKPLFTIDPDTGDVLLVVSTVSWEILGTLDKPLFTPVVDAPSGVAEVTWLRPTETRAVLAQLHTDPPLNVTQAIGSTLLRVPVVQITSDYKEVVAFNLSTANGELDGFK